MALLGRIYEGSDDITFTFTIFTNIAISITHSRAPSGVGAESVVAAGGWGIGLVGDQLRRGRRRPCGNGSMGDQIGCGAAQIRLGQFKRGLV